MRIADAPNTADVFATQLLLKMVCLLVDHPNDVEILTQAADGGATLVIRAHPQDMGKVIGSQGRTAKSLRTIMSGIGRKLGQRFTIVIDEDEGESTRAQLDCENISV
jgi:predicted RNA-binding protein YlqC (UPF0109 family)